MPPVQVAVQHMPARDFHRIPSGPSSSLYYSHHLPKPAPPAPVIPQSNTSRSTTPEIKKKARFASTISATAFSATTASMTPLLAPIIDRCLPPKVSPDSTPPPGHKSKKSPIPVNIAPYSRARDTVNDRSVNPSPREQARAAQMEVERAKAREEAAALARAAAAAKRKSKGKSRGGSKNGTDSVRQSRSISPKVTEQPPAEPTTTNGNGNHSTSHPGPAPPPRIGLKRTRSIGLGISTNTSNNLAPMAVGSPLRAVTGPNSPEKDMEDPRQGKRARFDPLKRRTSDSPTTTTVGLPSVNPINTPVLSVRRGSSGEATSMRRAVSATGLLPDTKVGVMTGSTAMTRTGSTGSDAGVTGRDRARREVTLPGRLRDYETRASQAV